LKKYKVTEAPRAKKIFVKAVNREHRIPFEIRDNDPFYSSSNQLHLTKSIQQLKDGKGTAHELIEDYDE
jgi:DNA-damage-inducible protein J